MSTVQFKTKQEKLATAVRDGLDAMLTQKPLRLPNPDDALVSHCVDRIQDSYDAANAKLDTDNAIDLLYIAYSATPHSEADIRNGIQKIIWGLIDAQKDSFGVMSDAIAIADRINGKLAALFPTWLELREPVANGTSTPAQMEDFRDFIKTELVVVATHIAKEAREIEEALLRCGDSYNGIIANTQLVTTKSSNVLGERIKEREALAKAMVEQNAKREMLESLVADLASKVKQFEAQAKDFESQAKSSEEKAFVLAIIGAAASVVAAIIPPVAMLASSGLVGAASRGKVDATPAATNPAVGDEAKTTTELATKKAKREAVNGEVEKLEKEIENLSSTSKPDDDEATKKASEARVSERQGVLTEKKQERAALDKEIGELGAALERGRKAAEDMSDKSRDQAANFRKMQMEMLNKAESYEKERREQAADLVRIKVLLQGQQSHDEKLQIAVRSLDLSISALKRMQEIIREIAFFFKSFADFMSEIAHEADEQLEEMGKLKDSAAPGYKLRQLTRATDTFFVKQSAEWHAVYRVSSLFKTGFRDGFTRLNELDGKFTRTDQWAAYLTTAAADLEVIAKSRQERADAKITDLGAYRKELEKSAA
ncbi:hypothetical protein [Dyella acidisoli]|uniref:Tyrosyl-tRNA deacylase n=1 Tax=Dyella acidisoli TaxID=1867834 RepID=A0ABQ5XME0_9GAMM|nr:hypothetical protein [Dyella acidisoli]GLQ91678.1 hypothetical protein GCM10007901_06280 [Dyella acidisoli]